MNKNRDRQSRHDNELLGNLVGDPEYDMRRPTSEDFRTSPQREVKLSQEQSLDIMRAKYGNNAGRILPSVDCTAEEFEKWESAEHDETWMRENGYNV
jgi:hypothetical protein